MKAITQIQKYAQITSVQLNEYPTVNTLLKPAPKSRNQHYHPTSHCPSHTLLPDFHSLVLPKLRASGPFSSYWIGYLVLFLKQLYWSMIDRQYSGHIESAWVDKLGLCTHHETITSCLAPDNHWLIYGWIKDVIISLFIFLEFSINKITFSSFQFLSHVRLSVTPWSATHQASLYITNSQSLLKLMSIESAMPSNHLILCRPLLFPPSIFPSIKVFSSESVLHIRWPIIGVSASASVFPINLQTDFL